MTDNKFDDFQKGFESLAGVSPNEEKLLISEIFYSVQGEGTMIGRPSVFLRLGSCNLHCVWCDTAYTWDWKRYNYEKELEFMSKDDVRDRILHYKCQRLVVTGGEPLLQQNALVRLLNDLKERNFYIEIETNGTLQPIAPLVATIDQWNVSPKLENSENSQENREQGSCYRLFRSLSSSFFKYVIQSPEDVKEVDELVTRYALNKKQVILMPEGVTRDVISQREVWLKEICAERGYNFSGRLHIKLWDNMRGT